ncbi:hypothetical protein FB384_000534 [Prauserella sediminis]|uniref:Uncharacterized protein n=1 Tax=Prauserella sediminis TaxID=577680 RepID=A0A839XEB5_9PSEU|nr:hypothetical protein [Prauserella sediminis]MBB3661630.1 hypothetical protein [Prauserella sediminis]
MTAEGEADVSIRSTVRAEEITFLEVPETRVEFSGDTDDRTSASGSRRVRLPDPVRAGVTYRDIGIDHWITANPDVDTLG